MSRLKVIHDNRHGNWTFSGICLVEDEKKYADLETEFDVEFSKIYFLLLVIYNTGDSFSHEEAAGVDFVELYRDVEAAEKMALEIRRHDDACSRWTDEKEYDLEITLDNGNRMKYNSAPWLGYFESIHDIRLVPVRLTIEEKSF